MIKSITDSLLWQSVAGKTLKSCNNITIFRFFRIFVHKLFSIRILCYANRADINTCRYEIDYRYQHHCHSKATRPTDSEKYVERSEKDGTWRVFETQ